MKKWIIYTAYILAVTIFFLYYLFPSDALTSYINSKLADSLPGFRLSVKQIRPTFPPGLNLKIPLLFRGEKQIFGSDELKIRPQYLTLLSATQSFVFNASSYGGNLKGIVDLSMKESQPQFNLNLSLNGIEIGNVPALKELIPHTVTGIANGDIVFRATAPYGNGKADITISGCQVEFKPALFGMDQLKMDAIATHVEMADGQVKIDQFSIKGHDLSGKATGSISVRNPIGKSAINISGLMTPTPTLLKKLGSVLPTGILGEKNITNEGIPFQISGTIEDPGFSLK